MTTEEIQEAFCNAMLQLFRTSPGSRANVEASDECARLQDLDPDACEIILEGFQFAEEASHWG